MSSSIPFNPSINLPIHPEYYQPRVFDITAISLGATTTVTTSADHDYVIGQLIRLHIPKAYGSFQLSGTVGYVIAIPAADEVVVDINSTNVNPFIASPTYGPTLPQIAAIGDINTGQINTGRTGNLTYIPGSFINISPAFGG